MEDEEQKQAWAEMLRAADEYGFKAVDVTLERVEGGEIFKLTNVGPPLHVTPPQIVNEAKRCGFTHVDLQLRDKRTNQLVYLWRHSVEELQNLEDYWRIEKWGPSNCRDPLAPKSRKHDHYFKDVKGMEYIDVYRVLDLFEVADPCIAHAVKKLLVSGNRGGGKDMDRDIQEAIDSLERYKEMRREENEINRNEW